LKFPKSVQVFKVLGILKQSKIATLIFLEILAKSEGCLIEENRVVEIHAIWHGTKNIAKLVKNFPP